MSGKSTSKSATETSTAHAAMASDRDRCPEVSRRSKSTVVHRKTIEAAIETIEATIEVSRAGKRIEMVSAIKPCERMKRKPIVKERVSVIIEWIVAGIKRGPVAIPRIAVI